MKDVTHHLGKVQRSVIRESRRVPAEPAINGNASTPNGKSISNQSAQATSKDYPPIKGKF